jgi:hypothetical protein
MNREITVTLTPELIKWSFRLRLRSSFNHVFIQNALIDSVSPLLVYKKNLKRFREIKNPILKYQITDEGINLESEWENNRYSWSVLKKFRKNEKVWGIITPSSLNIILSVELLDDEIKNFLSEKLTPPPPTFAKKLMGIVFLLAFLMSWIYLRVLLHQK